MNNKQIMGFIGSGRVLLIITLTSSLEELLQRTQPVYKGKFFWYWSMDVVWILFVGSFMNSALYDGGDCDFIYWSESKLWISGSTLKHPFQYFIISSSFHQPLLFSHCKPVPLVFVNIIYWFYSVKHFILHNLLQKISLIGLLIDSFTM